MLLNMHTAPQPQKHYNVFFLVWGYPTCFRNSAFLLQGDKEMKGMSAHQYAQRWKYHLNRHYLSKNMSPSMPLFKIVSSRALASTGPTGARYAGIANMKHPCLGGESTKGITSQTFLCYSMLSSPAIRRQ